MQGVGAVNMSMGGAATAQPLDISGAIQWNPATLSTFDNKILNVDIGAFFSAPELSSTVGTFSGITEDDRGVSPMPSAAMVWGKEDSKHTFGVSAFGISGFGVTFPENTTNAISMSQSMGGFGTIESNYMLMQVSLSWAYEITKNLSLGIQPNFNYATLELEPNPLASPSMTLGYPVSDNASAIGFGAQIGLYYESDGGVKIGASYKTAQKFSDFEFSNTYLDGSVAGDVDFQMDYPAIISFGLGYSVKDFDFAVDYRFVDYKNTEGFEASGWTSTAGVAGFGWESINVLSAGIQYKGIKKLPLRFGYTHSTNPINEDLAFFSIPATAVIKNAYQFGFGYEFSDKLTINGLYHHGDSGGITEGPMLSPMAITSTNPTGEVDGTSVGYEMTTDLITIGVSYRFLK